MQFVKHPAWPSTIKNQSKTMLLYMHFDVTHALVINIKKLLIVCFEFRCNFFHFLHINVQCWKYYSPMNLYEVLYIVFFLNNIQYFSQYTCLYYDALKWISILPLLHPSSSTAHYNGLKLSLCVSINLKRLLFAIKRHQNVLDTVLYTVHQLLWDLQLQRLRVCKTTKLCPLTTTGDKTEQRYFMT